MKLLKNGGTASLTRTRPETALTQQISISSHPCRKINRTKLYFT